MKKRALIPTMAMIDKVAAKVKDEIKKVFDMVGVFGSSARRRMPR